MEGEAATLLKISSWNLHVN